MQEFYKAIYISKLVFVFTKMFYVITFHLFSTICQEFCIEMHTGIIILFILMMTMFYDFVKFLLIYSQPTYKVLKLNKGRNLLRYVQRSDSVKKQKKCIKPVLMFIR